MYPLIDTIFLCMISVLVLIEISLYNTRDSANKYSIIFV